MFFKQQATRWGGRHAKSSTRSVIMLHRHLAQRARFLTSQSEHRPADKGGGQQSFSTLSQLIASLFPNKSFGRLFFSKANTLDTCTAHSQRAEDIKASQATNKNNRDSWALSASIARVWNITLGNRCSSPQFDDHMFKSWGLEFTFLTSLC